MNRSNIRQIARRSVTFQIARHAGVTTLASILYLQPLLVEPALFLRALGKLLLAPQHQRGERFVPTSASNSKGAVREMPYAAWWCIGRAAFHGAIRSMLERFSFGSALPLSVISPDANSRSERQNFGDGGTARGSAPTSNGSFRVWSNPKWPAMQVRPRWHPSSTCNHSLRAGSNI